MDNCSYPHLYIEKPVFSAEEDVRCYTVIQSYTDREDASFKVIVPSSEQDPEYYYLTDCSDSFYPQNPMQF